MSCGKRWGPQRVRSAPATRECEHLSLSPPTVCVLWSAVPCARAGGKKLGSFVCVCACVCVSGGGTLYIKLDKWTTYFRQFGKLDKWTT